MGGARRVLSIVTQAVAWVTMLAAVAVLAVAVVVPRLTGATPYAVLTGSMQPDLPAGTLVVVRDAEVDDIALGDVITYQLQSGRSTVVTHRVVGQGQNLSGETTLVTQGDANDVPDAERVRPVQVRGELWYSVPHLGHVNDVLNGKERQMVVNAVAAGLLLYAGVMVVGTLRDRRRTPKVPS
ncbi:signal peptidase I [Aeromicrobium sp. CTD01-1L150]|uniref:signal peptidase I n=1 Tax=Aeromicrobium sp. CTD01-1L150 TaxID=3341830 RepID=UPI0035BFA81C